MGLRGIGARPLSKRGQRKVEQPAQQRKGLRDVEPWTVPNMTRSQRVIAFCESFQITSGPDTGKFFKLRPWQRQFIEEVYREDGNGLRPVRTAILTMGRKNGKTALAALMALCHLCGPEAEPRGETYSCANDRAQASKIFAEAEASILGHRTLTDRITISSYTKTMRDLQSGSIFTALSSESRTKMGLSPSFVVYDELGFAPDRKLYVTCVDRRRLCSLCGFLLPVRCVLFGMGRA
jgi:phage terminase large subunit-like protein